MPIYIDQMMRKVEITHTPLRIISLVPSQTELLFDLGLNKEVVGITKFCIHPAHWLKEKTIIGGTKQLNIDKIASLKPDLIIGNKEENSKEDIEILMQSYPLWMSDINTFEDALEMIESIAHITHTTKLGNDIITKIKQEFAILPQVNKVKKRTAYFIWNKPMMVAGQTTFINEMLQICGFENVFSTTHHFKQQKESVRYPQINESELIAAQPELILLSSEPFPFKEKHVSYFMKLCPKAEIKIVDGEMFSWYGSRLSLAPSYFSKLIV